MKHFLSAFALAAQTTYLKILGVIAATAAFETGIFFLRLQQKGVTTPLDEFWNSFFLNGGFLLGWVALAFVLEYSYHSKANSRLSYTMRRLPHSPARLLLANGLYHSICYGFFAAVQLLLFWSFCQYYTHMQGDNVTAIHTTFLVFQQLRLLHILLPLNIWWGFLRNIAIFWAFGIFSAFISLSDEKSGKTSYPFYMINWFPFWAIFFGSNNSLDGLCFTALIVGIVLTIALYCIHYVKKGGLFHEEDVTESDS